MYSINKNTTLIFLFSLCFISILCAPQISIDAYKAPFELQQSLDKIFKNSSFKNAFIKKNKAHLAKIGCTLYETRRGNVVIEHPDLPGYLIKGEKPYQNRNWKRVLYGQEIRKAIGNHPSLIVATEYLYQYPGRPSTVHSDNYCVISKKIAFKNLPLASFLLDKPHLVKEIQKIMRTVGFWDPGIRNNIQVTEDEKIAFIDTEPYPDDHNFIVQPILNLIFFRLQKRGEFTAKKLHCMVEQARNPHMYKKESPLKTVVKYILCSLAIYAIIKMMHNH